jgi:hypothetical protein
MVARRTPGPAYANLRGLHLDIKPGNCGDRETWARPDDHVQNVIFKTRQLGLAWEATRGHDEGKRSG